MLDVNLIQSTSSWPFVEIRKLLKDRKDLIKSKDKIIIDNSSQKKHFASYNLVKTMRGSILVLGPLLAKFGYAKVSLPGGCAIGTRPIDVHLKALSKLGVKYKIEQGYVIARKGGTKSGTEVKITPKGKKARELLGNL